MNKIFYAILYLYKHNKCSLTILMISLFLICSVGCQEPTVSSPREVEKFEKAGPLLGKPQVEGNMQTSISSSYRISAGDVLEIRMPVILKDVVNSTNENEAYSCRVNDLGCIPLPILGDVNVVNKTLTETESTIANAYYPKYVISPPAVVCKVNEHLSGRVFTVTGLVRQPGVFPYPTNAQYSLVDAIASANGIDTIADPHHARIYRRDINGKILSALFRIDKTAINSVSNIVIKPGDVVSVEPTSRTQANVFFSQILRFNVGAYVNPNDM